MKKFLSLKEIQRAETEMLKKLILFLENNNINYYIWAGTFLGAVRHKGFIPWDDDIDLIIPRPDYNKLIKILSDNNKISDELFGIGYELNNSDWPFIKIINKCIFVEEYDMCDKNLWLDIFPLDGIPNFNRKFFYYSLKIKKNLFVYKRIGLKHAEFNPKSFIKKFLKYLLIFVTYPISYDVIITKLIKFASKYDYNTCKYVRNNVWSTAKNIYIDKDNMQSATYDFEGLKVNGLKDYDLYLSMCYGKDYMELPPVEKRVTHSFKAWRVLDDKEK